MPIDKEIVDKYERRQAKGYIKDGLVKIGLGRLTFEQLKEGFNSTFKDLDFNTLLDEIDKLYLSK